MCRVERWETTRRVESNYFPAQLLGVVAGAPQAGESWVWSIGLVTGPFLRAAVCGPGEISTDGHFPPTSLLSLGAPGASTLHSHYFKAQES